MKQYESMGGIKVYASSPDNASVEFCKEAEKAGIYLYEARKFNPDKVTFETNGKFFAFGKPSTILASGDQILILPIEKAGLSGEISTGYGVATPFSFEKWYKPVNHELEPEMPYNKLAGKYFYLDAGHGGKDSGAVNGNLGLQEKIAALDVCLYLGEYLEAQGAKVYYSRSGDTFPSLTERANEANVKDVTAFISIHLNSAENKSASGIETLVYALKGTAYDLATKVQDNLVEVTSWANRGVKARPELTVLKKTKMPAILCEIGFISNDTQAKELFRQETQKKIAVAIADGVIEQFGK